MVDEKGEKRLEVNEFLIERLKEQDPLNPLKKKVTSMLEVACEQAGNRDGLEVWHKNSSRGGSTASISYKTDGVKIIENTKGIYLEVVGRKFDRFGYVSAEEVERIPLEDVLRIKPRSRA